MAHAPTWKEQKALLASGWPGSGQQWETCLPLSGTLPFKYDNYLKKAYFPEIETI